MARKTIPVVYLSVMIILCIAPRHLVNSIPIDINNGHANNNQPYARHSPNHFHQHQQPYNEDSGRLHSNHNRLRRQSPDIKVTPGYFQHNPSESFVKPNGGGPAYHKHEESPQTRPNSFRHQPPPPAAYPGSVEAQETRYGRHSSSQQNSPSQGPPPARTYTSHPHSDENHAKQVPNSFESPIHPNEKNPRDDQKYSKPYPMDYNNPFPEATSPNHLPPPPPPTFMHRHPVPPTTVALVVVGVNGNSTLFIEYDVSDNDVTYETIMEVEESSDNNNNFEANDL